MPTKKEVKKEIDKMPDHLVDPVYKFIKEKEKKYGDRHLPSYKFNGDFDNKDIRKKAYE
jgi:hypothetical protein